VAAAGAAGEGVDCSRDALLGAAAASSSSVRRPAKSAEHSV
jgi:hypothetical protein